MSPHKFAQRNGYPQQRKTGLNSCGLGQRVSSGGSFTASGRGPGSFVTPPATVGRPPSVPAPLPGPGAYPFGPVPFVPPMVPVPSPLDCSAPCPPGYRPYTPGDPSPANRCNNPRAPWRKFKTTCVGGDPSEAKPANCFTCQPRRGDSGLLPPGMTLAGVGQCAALGQRPSSGGMVSRGPGSFVSTGPSRGSIVVGQPSGTVFGPRTFAPSPLVTPTPPPTTLAASSDTDVSATPCYSGDQVGLWDCQESITYKTNTRGEVVGENNGWNCKCSFLQPQVRY